MKEDYWQDYQVLKLETWINEFDPLEINIDKIQEYLNFIQEAVQNYDSSRYSEWHHVMPRCVDKDHKYGSEGIRINGADHFRAHLKLVDLFYSPKFRRRLQSALMYMKKNAETKYSDFDPELFEEARRQFAEALSKDNPMHNPEVRAKTCGPRPAISGKNHPMYGIHRCREANPFYGHIHSDEAKQAISRTRIEKGLARGSNNYFYDKHLFGELNSMFGRKHTDESRQLMSQKKIGINNPCYGKIFINNGKINQMIPGDSDIPVGWNIGRLSKKYIKDSGEI